MDPMGWALAVFAAAAVLGVLVIGLLGTIALRRCPEGDIPLVLEGIAGLFLASKRTPPTMAKMPEELDSATALPGPVEETAKEL